MLENNGKIYEGREFWPKPVLDGLKKKSIGNRTYEIYSDIPMSMYDSLYHTRNRVPDNICLVDDDGRRYTYRQFCKLVDDFSRVLCHIYNVTPGTHVGVLLYNSLDFCVSIYAISRLQAVAVPLPTKYREGEIHALILKADLKGIIFHRDYEKWFQNKDKEMFCICMGVNTINALSHLPEVPRLVSHLEKEAILMFTSGTTSHSKGVLLKNYNIMHAIAVYQKVFKITEKDVSLIPVPAYHVTGLIALLGLFIYTGGCIYLHKFFDAERVLKEVEKNNITFLHASPTVYSLLLERKEQYPKLPSLRMLACGSGNMPKQKLKEIGEWIPQMEFRTVYGLTETSSPATVFPENAVTSIHKGSSGCPVPGVQFQICDDNNKRLLPYQKGTIMVRGTTVISDYYRKKREEYFEDWLDTGDLGYFDKSGYLYIVDRKKDMINRGGEKICSYDVENILYAIPGIKEVAVVGIHDERYGEVPMAMAVLEKESCLKEEQIKSILEQKLAKFQIPVRIVFCKNLPMTANMKIDKKKIRELLSKVDRREI